MGERAGWQGWECPTCGRRWDLEHYYAEDGRYLGCSWIMPAEVSFPPHAGGAKMHHEQAWAARRKH